MNTVKLRTGEEAFAPMVTLVMSSLEELIKKDPIGLVFYDLVMLCRNPNYKLFGNAEEVLRERNLIETDGQPHDLVRSIVLAATEGEGLEMKLVSPLAPSQPKPTKAQVTKRTADLYDFDLYMAARKVTDLVFEHARESLRKGEFLKDRRSEGANPFYNQTANGFFLEFYYGKPGSLWTPWGKWSFTGSSSGGVGIGSLLQDLEATLYEPERTSNLGTFGPVYAIHKIDKIVLPDPVELDPSAYSSYEESKTAWEELTKRYLSLKS